MADGDQYGAGVGGYLRLERADEGTLFIDRLSPFRREIAKKKLKKALASREDE